VGENERRDGLRKEYRIIAEGIVTFGILTPWSDVRSVVLAREPGVTVGGLTVAESYLQIIVELMNGDFLEIPEGSPSWDSVVDHLPIHRPLRVPDLPALLATDGVEDAVLWRA